MHNVLLSCIGICHQVIPSPSVLYARVNRQHGVKQYTTTDSEQSPGDVWLVASIMYGAVLPPKSSISQK